MGIPFAACMIMTANFYHLPPRVLPSIQAVEGGRIGLVHHNSDGSDDLGIMQINTRWIAPIAHFIRWPDAAVRLHLLGDACFNIAAAGAILRVYLNEAHGDLMLAIGYYHSHTPALNQSYQAQVLRSATAMFANRSRN